MCLRATRRHADARRGHVFCFSNLASTLNLRVHENVRGPQLDSRRWLSRPRVRTWGDGYKSLVFYPTPPPCAGTAAVPNHQANQRFNAQPVLRQGRACARGRGGTFSTHRRPTHLWVTDDMTHGGRRGTGRFFTQKKKIKRNWAAQESRREQGARRDRERTGRGRLEGY